MQNTKVITKRTSKEAYFQGARAPYVTQPNVYTFKKRQPNNKSKNKSFLKTLALIFWTICIGFSIKANYSNFLGPVYINRIENKSLNFDAKTIYAPTLNYMNNLNLFNLNLLSGVPETGRERIIPIVSSGENIILKNEINNILKGYSKLHAGVFVYDYMSGKTVEINSDEIFPAASIIKIPVLLEMFNRSKALSEEGFSPIDLNQKMTFKELHRTEGSGNLQFKSANVEYTLDYLAKIMIRSSDNSATNMLIENEGGIGQVNASLRHWGLNKTQISNWLPDIEGTNTTTPKDIATMLYNIDNQNFLTLQSAANIKEYMSKVENRTLFKSQIPDSAVLVHKTGDIGKMLGDAGIVYTESGKKFIIVTMVKRPHNDYGARELIQKVAHAVYDNLN